MAHFPAPPPEDITDRETSQSNPTDRNFKCSESPQYFTTEINVGFSVRDDGPHSAQSIGVRPA